MAEGPQRAAVPTTQVGTPGVRRRTGARGPGDTEAAPRNAHLDPSGLAPFSPQRSVAEGAKVDITVKSEDLNDHVRKEGDLAHPRRGQSRHVRRARVVRVGGFPRLDPALEGVPTPLVWTDPAWRAPHGDGRAPRGGPSPLSRARDTKPLLRRCHQVRPSLGHSASYHHGPGSRPTEGGWPGCAEPGAVTLPRASTRKVGPRDRVP